MKVSLTLIPYEKYNPTWETFGNVSGNVSVKNEVIFLDWFVGEITKKTIS